MSQSRKVVHEFGSIQVGHATITDDDIGQGYGDVSGPASSTDNALVRFDGTGGKTVQASTVTLSDAGVLSATGALGLTAGTTLTLTSPVIHFSRAAVTQTGSVTNAVTINAPSGQVTTVSLTTAAGDTDTFTVNNTAVTSASTVVCTLLYAGTLGTQGIPVVTINGVASGAFTVNITNVHGTNALANFCKVHFIVV